MGLSGTRWLIFEARRAEETAILFRKAGAEPTCVAVLREVPTDEAPAVLAFGTKLERGECDLLIAETGVGVRFLWRIFEPHYGADKARALLDKPVLVARSSKPAAAFRELGLNADVLVPEPNTWREILNIMRPRPERRVTVLEYGKPDERLLAGLADQKRAVDRVCVYHYELPDDLAPIDSALMRLIAGEFQGVAFTTSGQVDHLMEAARRLGKLAEVRTALGRTFVASIGPTTTGTLREAGFSVAFEPSTPKLGPLVQGLNTAYPNINELRAGA